MATFSSCATVDGDPEAVLDVLTDPDACRRWAPVAFEVSGLDGDRLRTGSQARVAGRMAGRSVEFDVEILRAGEAELALRAAGPIEIEAHYLATPRAHRTRLDATVTIQPRPGLRGLVLAAVTEAFLAAGALDASLDRIARQVSV